MRLLRLLALVAALSGSGCAREDADKLARAGSKLAEKLRAIVPERMPFAGWNSVSADSTAEARVRARIMSDRYLAPLNIEVTAAEGGVRLRGHIDDDMLKRRAMEMAESTVGVQAVVDELSTANP